MKRILLAIILVIPNFIHAQYVDYWKGELNMGMKLLVEFNVTYQLPNPRYISLDVPDQSVWELECELGKWTKDSFNIDISSINVKFTSQKQQGDSVAIGIWEQNGFKIPLTLHRSFNDTKPNRPQHPTEIPEYLVEELAVMNEQDHIQLHAVLTIPKEYKIKACAVLVSGSGKQDYDETIAGHKPFWVIADYLTRNGYAVIRFDDRGSYRSTGNFDQSTIYDFAEDVNAIINMAKERTGIQDDSKMGLIGHSEGSMVSQIVLTQRKLGFFISLAGPGAPVTDLMLQQNEDLSPALGIPSNEFVKSVKPALKEMFVVVANLKLDSAAALVKIKKIFKKKSAQLPQNFKTRFGIGTEAEGMIIGGLLTKPFREFMAFKPSLYLSKIKTPILAINGTKDLQVNSNLNLKVFESYKGNNSLNEVVYVENKNHLFQTTKSGSIAEYGKLDETFSPEVLTIMVNWLDKIY